MFFSLSHIFQDSLPRHPKGTEVTAARQLYALQQLDSRLAGLERTLATLDDGTQLRAQAEQARTAEESTAADLKAGQTRLRDLELELQSVVDKARKLETEMYSGRVTNPKELSAMQDDVGALGRQRRRIEDEMLSLMEAGEGLAKEVGILAAQRQARERETEDHQVQYQAHTRALTEEIAAVRAERNARAAEVDPDLLRRYERLRERKDGLAVAAVVNGICEGCHVAIPEGRIADIVEGERLYTCEECGRILHVPEG